MTEPGREDLDALTERGSTLVAQGDLEGAAEAYEAAVATCRALVEETVLPRIELARVLAMHAMSLSMGGESREAVRVGREAYELTGALYGREHDCTLVDLARIAVNFGRWLAFDGEGDEALECAYYGLQHLDELTPGDPETYLGWRIALLKAVAEVDPEADEPMLSVPEARRDLVDSCRRLVAVAPHERRHLRSLAEALVLHAAVVAGGSVGAGGEPDGEPPAVALTREAVSIQRSLVSPPSGVNDLAKSLSALWDVLSDLGRDAEAESEIAAAAADLPAPWNEQLPTLVLVWQWVLAPTYGQEQSVLEFEDSLREPSADGIVELALAEIGAADANRLRALRNASREMSVAEAYQRRAQDPFGFVVAHL